MSTVRDRNVIDVTLTENDRYVLIINDDLPWSFGERQSHARTLQDKINGIILSAVRRKKPIPAAAV